MGRPLAPSVQGYSTLEGINSSETERSLKANNREYNSQFRYANNYIRTSKYNILTFIPVNLFEQFLRIANFYFLVLFIMQLIGPISSLNPVTTGLPLVFVLAVTATKDGVDDFQRHRSDSLVNNRQTDILVENNTQRKSNLGLLGRRAKFEKLDKAQRGRYAKLTSTRWQDVQVGDIIRMENNEFVAADLLLLSSSEPHSLVYIETAELDGETNLKVRQALPETALLGEDLDRFKNFKAEVKCEPPNNKLDRFEGTLTWEGDSFPLSNDQILLRGCRLRNTKWCYGIVIFAGRDTKLMQNSGKSKFKRTSIDRMVNKLVLVIFLILFVLCLICSIACSVWEANYGDVFQAYLPWEYDSPAIIATLVFFSYVIVLNTLVPISLYVTVELIRMFQSLWISWDKAMYYAPKDTPAKARSTNLNEELGQIQYVFSDKTGTLTQNIMTFNKASIAGRKFGELKDENGDVIEITDQTPLVDFSKNNMYEPSFKFYDKSLPNAIDKGDRHCWLFFRLLSLCHTVMPEIIEGKLQYQAQSPDEAALVSAARNFGFVFKSRTPTTITLEVQGEVDKYELLHILDFNNVRKRMSVVVRQGRKIRLYCKGADNVILARLGEGNEQLVDITNQHLRDFAGEGLRTLCLAMKDVDEAYYQEWKRKHHAAATSLDDREAKLDELYEEIETNLTLLGATAIEDKLQDGVPTAIENLHKANIKLWVLTGDKQETAINIGYSCKLLTDEMNEMFIVNATEKDLAEQEIKNCLEKIRDVMGIKDKQELQDAAGDGDDISYHSKDEDELNDVYSFALVITGAALAFALGSKDIEQVFLEAACYCKTVICCRVTPLQKAQVVDLVKRYKKAVTLAIGDGANDVSMIKTAHIGVGISGQEGMQAVLSSDFSFAQFRYLERLLLVHGRWSYYRMSKFLSYFFYKNFAQTVGHFWFAFFCGFSAMTLYDEWYISAYNIIFTSLPVIALGIFDQDVSDKKSIEYPELYKPGQKSLFFNYVVFAKSLLQGTVTSLVLFFITYGALNGDLFPDAIPAHSQALFGCIIATMVVVVVNLKIALDTAYWNIITHIVIWGSIVFYLIFIFMFYSLPFYATFSAVFTYVGVPVMMFRLPSFYFSLVLVCTILLLPLMGKRAVQADVQPMLVDKVRLEQRREQQELKKARKKSLALRGFRTRGSVRDSMRSSAGLQHGGSSLRRPASTRSGYAFSHQEGFGEIIQKGVNMRDIKEEEQETEAKVC
ncbi:phospholipid-transporting ATPase ID-like isoform X2 [Acanthaster planci]|uniref:Phospholipid-transporting ATPase n=1 Tax=Acanthaster planci TaxID=133434 RepID=A0A8B7ZNJ1_ACAPL|nr:phospholipid-transporting ATPase ID-like isoform X2 [Acanthaster planci]